MRLRLLCAPAIWIFLPVATLPVKLIFRTPMCLAISSPVFPGPLTNWTTPLGMPALSIMGPSANVASGVFSDGFTITTLPVTSAGATLWKTVATGELKGQIAPQTLRSGSAFSCSCVLGGQSLLPYPRGSFLTSLTKPSSSGMYSPLNLSHQPAGACQ